MLCPFRLGIGEPLNSTLVIETVSDRRRLREFLRLPWKLYAGDPYWVPPLLADQRKLLDPRRHPFYRNARRELFLARRGGEVCGRVAAIVDELHNQTHGDRTGFFGFFECVDDPAVAAALLGAARQWVQQHAKASLRGPVNPSLNYESGLLVDGFHTSPTLLMPHNPPYYARLLESCGFQKSRDMYTYWLDRSFQLPEKVRRIAQRVVERGRFRVRSAEMKHFQREVDSIRAIYNAAWRRLWGFVPMTDEEFAVMARSLKPIVLPEFVLLAEVDGRAVGFLLALPDVNQVLKRLDGHLLPFGFLKLLFGLRRIDVLRVPIMGFLPEHQKVGAAAVMYLELARRALAQGYQGLEMSWILEDNTMMNRAAEMLGARRRKTYRIYESSCEPPQPGVQQKKTRLLQKPGAQEIKRTELD